MAGILSGAAGGASVLITIRAIDKASEVFSSVNKSMLAIGAGITAIGVGGAIALVSFAKDAANAGDIIENFNKIVGTEGPKVLKEMQDATLGTVDKFQLMGSINDAVTKGISADAIPTMALYAQQLKDAGVITGSVTDTIDSMSTAVATGRLMTLNSMGIMVDADKVYQDYAKSINKTAENLTELQKKEALQKAILDEIKKKSEGMAKPTADFADNMAKLTAQMTELKVIIGNAVLPVLSFLAEKIGIVVGWFAEHPTIAKWTGIILLVGTALALIIGPILMLIAVLPALVAGFGLILPVIIPLLLPILGIIAGITALVVIGYLLIKNWELIKAKFKEVWEGLKQNFKEIWTGIINIFEKSINWIIDKMENLANFVIKIINTMISAINLIPGINIKERAEIDLASMKFNTERPIEIVNIVELDGQVVSRSLSKELNNKVSL